MDKPKKPWGHVPPYKQPNNKFRVGEAVQFRGELPLRWIIVGSSHTHSQLEGLPKAVPNWLLVKASSKQK